jgi:hypothetical protein
MKKTLWLFGDSFTQSLVDNKDEWATQYVEWKGYAPKVYGEILADTFGFNLMNYGSGGIDNYSIFQNICNLSDKIFPNDVIIIGWTSVTRFRLVDKWNNWKRIIPKFDRNVRNLEDVSNTTLEEILINRTKERYTEEVCSWIKLLNTTFSNNLIINWSALDRGVSKNYIANLTTIRDESGGIIDDGHYGEVGHIQLANEFSGMINSNTSIRMI